eukprot:2407492-Prymnesium_polylepis.1
MRNAHAQPPTPRTRAFNIRTRLFDLWALTLACTLTPSVCASEPSPVLRARSGGDRTVPETRR